MATKGKDKILEGQIAFDFLSEIEIIKPKKEKVKKIEKPTLTENKKTVKVKSDKIVQPKPKKFRKLRLNIKRTHFKAARKVRRVPRKFIREK